MPDFRTLLIKMKRKTQSNEPSIFDRSYSKLRESFRKGKKKDFLTGSKTEDSKPVLTPLCSKKPPIPKRDRAAPYMARPESYYYGNGRFLFLGREKSNNKIGKTDGAEDSDDGDEWKKNVKTRDEEEKEKKKSQFGKSHQIKTRDGKKMALFYSSYS